MDYKKYAKLLLESFTKENAIKQIDLAIKKEEKEERKKYLINVLKILKK